MTNTAAASLLAAGFERQGWAWQHAETGTMVIEATDGGMPEVYNESLPQADVDARVALSFSLAAWDADFGSRLLRWVRDAIVQDGAAAVEDGEADSDNGKAAAAQEEAARAVDVGLSMLPTAEALGANVQRQLTIYTWGDKVVSQLNLEKETGCTKHFNAKPLSGRGGGADLKCNATQDARIVRNVVGCMRDGEGSLWLRRVVQAVEACRDGSAISVYCSQGRHRSVSAALILASRYYPLAQVVHIKMR